MLTYQKSMEWVINTNFVLNYCRKHFPCGVVLSIHVQYTYLYWPITNYNKHIAKTVSICLHKLVQINRIKHLLDKKTILLLMSSFVFSKLYYCSTVWSNTSKHNINKLQLVQNFAARVVLGLKKFDHISQAIKSLNWLPVNTEFTWTMQWWCTNVLINLCLTT